MIAVKSRLYSPLEFKLLCYCCYVWQIWLVWFFFFVLSHILEIWEWELCWHWKLQKLNQASGKQMVSKCSCTPFVFQNVKKSKAKNCIRRPPELIIFGRRRAESRSGFLHWWYFFASRLLFLVRVGTFVFILFFGCVFSTFSGVSLEYTKVVVLKAIGHVKKTMHFPGDCLGNWPQSLRLLCLTLICWL